MGMAKQSKAKTVGELKALGYQPVSLREEMRRNLIAMIKEEKGYIPRDNRLWGYGHSPN